MAAQTWWLLLPLQLLQLLGCDLALGAVETAGVVTSEPSAELEGSARPFIVFGLRMTLCVMFFVCCSRCLSMFGKSLITGGDDESYKRDVLEANKKLTPEQLRHRRPVDSLEKMLENIISFVNRRETAALKELHAEV